MSKLVKKPKTQKIVILRCPTCGKDHPEDNQFGNFCCASCLQTVIRPLIVTPVLHHTTVKSTFHYLER